MGQAKKKETFADKRGCPGSVISGKDELTGKDRKLQVFCACNGNYTREARKLKTIPVDARAVAGDSFHGCDECSTVGYVVMARKEGESALYNWRGKATKSLAREDMRP